MIPIRFALAAEQDLDEIADRIATEHPAAVDRVLDQIEHACHAIADYPGIGRPRPEIAEGVLGLPVGAYVIFYRVTDDAVGIARILHASRDLPNAFSDAS